MNVHFGKVLKAARRDAGLTQGEAADRTPYSQGYWSVLERTATYPRQETVEILERVVGRRLILVVGTPMAEDTSGLIPFESECE
jgi:transcriptional regulator with XRE-family HTH domain